MRYSFGRGLRQFALALIACACGTVQAAVVDAIEYYEPDLDHYFVMHRRGFLREKPKAATLLKSDFAGIGLLAAENHVDERGFASAVRTDQPDSLSAVQLQRSFAKQLTSSETFVDIHDRKHPKAAKMHGKLEKTTASASKRKYADSANGNRLHAFWYSLY